MYSFVLCNIEYVYSTSRLYSTSWCCIDWFVCVLLCFLCLCCLCVLVMCWVGYLLLICVEMCCWCVCIVKILSDMCWMYFVCRFWICAVVCDVMCDWCFDVDVKMMDLLWKCWCEELGVWCIWWNGWETCTWWGSRAGKANGADRAMWI